MKINLKSIIPILIILILSFWSIFDILKPGFFPMHDNTQVVRVYEMAKSLKMDQFPVRWVPDLGYGYGYAIFNFYSPLPYYIGGLVNLIGFDALMATKIMFIIGILISGISMYFFAKEFWGKWGGVLSALLYVYAPYHLLDIYVRGAVGEFWAIAFLPLVFLGIYKIYISNLSYLIISSLSFSAVILSHNITAMLLALFLILIFIILLLISLNKKQFAICYTLFAVSALSLSAFFWFPAIMESGLTKVAALSQESNDFRLHFVCLPQLWDSPWGFGGSVPGCIDGLSFQIGKFHLLYAIVGVVGAVLVAARRMSTAITKILPIFFLLLLFSIFMTLSISAPVWNLIPPLKFAQYPWRFLSFVILFTSFFSGAILTLINVKFIKVITFIILIALPLIKDYQFTKPRYISNWTAESYINDKNIKWTTSKISDEYLPKDFLIPENLSQVCWDQQSCDSERKMLADTLTRNTLIRTMGNIISLAGICFTTLLCTIAFRFRQQK